MRKIMLLGGARYELPIIEAAHSLGLYVITADYLPNNVAHKYSDEYCNVDITNLSETLDFARKLKIDGIMSFACDPGVVTAAYVAEKMGLPSVGSYEAVSILQNKGRFRKFLSDNKFNVPLAETFCDVHQAVRRIEEFRLPLIVKPTDSAGSKGVTKLESYGDAKKSVEYAMQYSRSKEVIIEEFLQQKGYSSDTDSFSIDGELKFCSFNCQLFDRNARNPFTPAAYCWPASISDAKQEELRKEIQRLISLLGLKTSIYNIETRECVDGKAYIMECSPRGGGNRLAEMLKISTGVDLVTNAVRAAVGDACTDVEQKPYKGLIGEIILHADRPGLFRGLSLSDEIREYIIEEDLWIQHGDHVGEFTAANAAIGTLVLQFKNREMLERVLNDQASYFKVITA